MTHVGAEGRALAALIADRPLGPVFESRFEAYGLRVHLSVVRGDADLLDFGRDRVEELLDRWLGGGPAEPTAPDTLLLHSIAGDRAASDLAPALTADLVIQDLVEEGALGAAVRVEDDAAFLGLPPRPEGWRVQVPGPDATRRVLLVGDGGVATRGRGSLRVTVTADRAWRAATDALAQTGAVSSTSRSAPA